jgi:hypothetical protein
MVGLVGLAAFVAAPVPEARAERDIRLLMDMDHHLVRADFIAFVQVESAWFFTDENGLPTQHVEASVVDGMRSRWGWLDTIEFETDAGFHHFQDEGMYLVLMSGGPWHQSPFTHRENSVFELLPDGTLACSGGDLLYGVAADGFYCAPPGSVASEPVDVDTVYAELKCAIDRAGLRLPTLQWELDKDPPQLEKRASSKEELEVRR